MPVHVETTLEAARLQKIGNIQVKTACLENEEYIQELHVSDWSDNQRQLFANAHEKAHELLHAVERDTKWHVTESYSAQRLMRELQLELQPKNLYRPEDKPKLADMHALRRMLLELRQHPNKARYVSFTSTIDSALGRIERIAEELKKTQIDGAEIAELPVQIVRGVEDIMNVKPSAPNLQAHDEEINQILSKIEKVKEIRNVALADGEMVVAEEQFYLKAQLLEELVELIRDKFRILAVTEDENRMFSKFAGGPITTFKATGPMKDREKLLKKKCEADLRKLDDAIQKADLVDAESMRAHSYSGEKSDKIIRENEDKQVECWKKMQEVERQLQRLGTERFEEVKKRIEDNECEEKRKVTYQQFLGTVSQHRKLLELSVFNCDAYLRSVGLMEDVISELTTALKARHAKCNIDLSDQRLTIHQQYLDAFRRLYKTLGQLIYKKEKRLEEMDRQIRTSHIELEFSIETFDPNAKKHSEAKKLLHNTRAQVEDEYLMLKEKQKQAEENFAPTAEALLHAGIDFIHPAEDVQEGNLARRSKMVEYRHHLHKAEEVRVLAEREGMKKQKMEFQSSPTFKAAVTGRSRDPYSPVSSAGGISPADLQQLAAPASPSTGNPRKALIHDMNGTPMLPT